MTGIWLQSANKVTGGMAIEDASSLCVLFPSGTPKDEIPDRLALYEKVRMHRAHKVQEFTRQAGADLDDKRRGSFNSECRRSAHFQASFLTRMYQLWSSRSTTLRTTSGTTRLTS